jgi:hypothetical protein
MIGIAAAALFLLASPRAPQEPAASAPVALVGTAVGPKEPVELGVPFEIVVTRRFRSTEAPPAWSDAALAPLVVVAKGVETQRNGGEAVETRRFEARAFGRGEVEVPAVGLRLTVKSALADPESPVEAPPGPFEMPFRWQRLAWILGIAAAALAAAFAFASWARRRPKRLPPAPPPIPPSDRAMARLAALRAMAVASDEAVQRFHVEVSSIVRDYIEERLGVRAPEMTTEEFLASPATREALAEPHQKLLREFLDHCDLVKFARRPSNGPDRERLCGAAERFVQETRA